MKHLSWERGNDIGLRLVKLVRVLIEREFDRFMCIVVEAGSFLGGEVSNERCQAVALKKSSCQPINS